MSLKALITASVVLTAVPAALGYPGMDSKVAAAIVAREDDWDDGPQAGDSFEIIGDLVGKSDKQLTTVGSQVKALLSGAGSPQSTDLYKNIPALKTTTCQKDVCCVWSYIVPVMTAMFKGDAGRCSKFARMAIRLGFHDAAGWDKATAAKGLPGGADGSIILNKDELNYSENNGLQQIAGIVKAWYDDWHTKQGFTQITVADLIQVGASVATVSCPLGPRMRTYVGRKDSSKANPRLLPSPWDSGDNLIALFQNKTIEPNGLVALLGAHSTSQQYFVDAQRSGDPQDSTPGVWDVLYYQQVLSPSAAPKRVYMFQSDAVLAKHPSTSGEWNEYANSQELWADVGYQLPEFGP